MLDVTRGFEGFFLIILFDVISGEWILYIKLISLRNTPKDKPVSFYIF